MTMTRRNLMKSAAWSAPVVALAVAAPAAVASDSTGPEEPTYCRASDGLTAWLYDDRVVIDTSAANGTAIDVTIRYGDGLPQYHRNYVTQGKNPGDNQILYAPGDLIVIQTPRRLVKSYDWWQFKTIHDTDCGQPRGKKA